MKKMMLILSLVIASVGALFADEKEDVVNVIRQCDRYGANGDFDKSFSYYTADFKLYGSDGKINTVNDVKTMLQLMDGKHPYEFLLFGIKMKNNGQEPSAEMKQQLKAVSKDQEFLDEYHKACRKFFKYVKKALSLELKTMKVLDVQINGNEAVVTISADNLDPNTDQVKKVTTVYQMKKIGGRWKICRQQEKK